MSFLPRLIVALRKPVVMVVKKPTPLTYIGAGRLRQAAELLTRLPTLLAGLPGMTAALRQRLDELIEIGRQILSRLAEL